MNAQSFAAGNVLVTLSCSILLTCVLHSAHGQTLGPVPDLALEFSPTFAYDLNQEIFYSQIHYSKVTSATEVAPEYNSAGSVNTTFLSIGTRTKNFEQYDFRWRAGLLKMDMTRIPISMGVTLVDYNQAERLETDVKWVNLRLGPALYLGSPRNYFTLRVIGSAGLTTAKVGDYAYSGLASGEGLALRKRSYEIGYLGEAFAFFANKIAISGSFSHRHLLGGIRPKFYEIKGVLGVRATDFITIYGTYSIEVARSGSSSLENYFAGFGMGILL